MATIKENKEFVPIVTRQELTLSKDDKIYLSFANLTLSDIANAVSKMEDVIMNEKTGEILETQDINRAFSLIYTLTDEDAVWINPDLD